MRIIMIHIGGSRTRGGAYGATIILYKGLYLIVLNLDRALTRDKMLVHWISLTFLVGIALCAIRIHAAPQPLIELLALGEQLGRDLNEEDHKFVTDPSANSDGNHILIARLMYCVSE